MFWVVTGWARVIPGVLDVVSISAVESMVDYNVVLLLLLAVVWVLLHTLPDIDLTQE
jgi:hypothetical protein